MQSILGYAQELPPIQSFTTDLYKAGNQNWMVTQNTDGVVFFANNEGLLSFDGSHWRLSPSPNASILRSVHAIKDIIYSGAYMDFGYWKPLKNGILSYVSLAEKLGFQMLEDEQIWNINQYKQFVIFQSLNRLIIYNQLTNTLRSLTPIENISKSFFVGEDVYIQTVSNTIYKVSNDKLIEVLSANRIRNNAIIHMLEYKDGVLLLTAKNGFLNWESNTVTTWRSSSQELFKQSLAYSATKISDQYIAVGTVTDGLIIIDATGSLVFSYQRENGLNNNTVLSTFVDMDNNLWVGLDNGISYINLNSETRFYYDNLDALGSVYTSAYYKDKLYLGTNQGLFCKIINSNEAFKKINGLEGQVWNLKEIDGTLFCAHNLGVFQVDGVQIKPIYTGSGAWHFMPTKPDEIMFGSYDGLHILKKATNQWRYNNKMTGFNISSRFFELTSDTTALVSHEYKGVFNLTFNQKANTINSVEILPVEKGLNSSLESLNGSVYYFNKGGFFEYNKSEQTFDINIPISNITKEDIFSSGKMISINDEYLFMFSKNYVYKVQKNVFSDELVINKFFLGESVRKDVLGYENINSIGSGKYLLGSTEGYLITDFLSKNPLEKEILISKVSAKNLSQQQKLINLEKEVDIPSDFNTISFEYSLPAYQYNRQIKYRYLLEGYNKGWSKWTNKSQVTFGNLSFGDYNFRLEAKASQDEVKMTTRSFYVIKPWYITNLMITIYILVFFSIAFLINNQYKRYYSKQRLNLIEKNNRKMELIELRNNEVLIQLKNNNLEESLKSKNREIAIATMAIVKKNQFLKSILDDLENIEQKPLVRRIIRIIKSNSKNKDDWEFFREAFDNSDKDFLKNLKAKHPILTHNDMRLCAYLRLNLTSKEIAPLFSISTKSVEIKRYRLRTKMGLAHDENLVNYIINL